MKKPRPRIITSQGKKNLKSWIFPTFLKCSQILGVFYDSIIIIIIHDVDLMHMKQTCFPMFILW